MHLTVLKTNYIPVSKQTSNILAETYTEYFGFGCKFNVQSFYEIKDFYAQVILSDGTVIKCMLPKSDFYIGDDNGVIYETVNGVCAE